MNILVIGNGFDLAHGLPTKYTDFLEWTVGQYNFFYILKKQNSDLTRSIDHISLRIPEKIKGIEISQRVEHQEEIWNCIDENVWIEYFLPIYADREKNGKDGWIDFESEISQIIQSLDDDMNSPVSQHFNLDDKVQNISNVYLYQKYIDWFAKRTYKELRDTLLNDLNKLIRTLEIYLCEYVEKMETEEKSPNINALDIDFILSFNYTHIFTKLYNVSDRSKQEVSNPFDYIHGEVKIYSTIETNNMVLGIDEYLRKKRRNKDTEFIAFKKYYQRIYKQTGSKYKKWVEIIRNQIQEIDDKIKNQYPVQIPYNKIPNKCRNQLFIFGHSLDITDKDILRELILNDNVYTTIFYYNKDAMGQQIANLVKVIGQDELIRRTGGNTKTIEFVPQDPMVPINKQQSNWRL